MDTGDSPGLTWAQLGSLDLTGTHSDSLELTHPKRKQPQNLTGDKTNNPGTNEKREETESGNLEFAEKPPGLPNRAQAHMHAC